MSEVKNKRILKEIANYFKAIYLYLNNKKSKYWYRKSTGQWVLEVEVQINPIISITSRYPHKVKLMTNYVWLLGFHSAIIEVVKALNFNQ